MERECAVLARKVIAVVRTCEWPRVTQCLVLVADTRPASVCARTPTNTHLFQIIQNSTGSQNADINVLCIKKSDIKIYSHVVEGGSADSDQATVSPWPGHTTSPEEDGGLSKSQTSVFKVAKSTPALAQTVSKTHAQAHAQMRNQATIPSRKQAAATAQVQTQQRKEGSSIYLSEHQVYFSEQ